MLRRGDRRPLCRSHTLSQALRRSDPFCNFADANKLTVSAYFSGTFAAVDKALPSVKSLHFVLARLH